MTPERRQRIRDGAHAVAQGTRTGWREVWREICWTFGMLDEGNNPSLIRAGAVVLFVVGAHGAVAHERPLTTNDVVVLSLACFATLGLKGMQLFKDWRGVKLESVQADLRADIRQEIADRRHLGREWDAEAS